METIVYRGDAPAYVASLDALVVGEARLAGCRAEYAESGIDPAVGIVLERKVGERVEPGDPLCRVYFQNDNRYPMAAQRLLSAYSFSSESPDVPDLIIDRMS